MLKNAGQDIGDFIRGLDKAVPMISAISLGLVGIAGFGLTAASNILAFGSSLASIGPAALALPGIVGGLAIGVIAAAVALKDFNKYVPDFAVGLGRTAKAGAAWKKLQDDMSSNFWVKAAKPIRELLGTLFPQFADGMRSISSNLGGFFGKLATSLSGAFNGTLGSMFKDLSASIDVAAGGTDAYAGIIKNLGAVGAGYLPRLAGWFVDISKRFDSFIAKSSADGRLKGWIDTAIIALKDLGSIIANISGIFAGLARAATAAGGSSFGVMADSLERVNKAVNSPAFQTGLVSVLFAAHQAFKAIFTQSGPGVSAFFESLGKVLVQILPGVGTAIGSLLDGLGRALSSPAFTTGFVAMFAGIEKAVNSLYPAFVPLGAALGALGPVIGALAANLGPLVTQLVVGLEPSFTKVANAVTPLIPILGGMLSGAISVLIGVINVAAGVFVFFATQAAQHTTTFKVIVIAALVLIGLHYTILGAQALANAALQAAAWVKNTIAAVVATATFVAKVAVQVFWWGVLAINAALGAAGVVLAWISTAAAAILNVAIAVAQEVIAVLSWIAHGVAATANALIIVAGWIAVAAGAVVSAASAVISFAVWVGGWIAMAATATISAITMAAAWVIALGPIALVIAVVVALVVLIILNWDTVKNATIVVWNAISAAVAASWDFITGLVSGAIRAVVNIVTGAWNAIQNATSAVWNAIQSVTSGGVSGAVAFIASLPGRALGAMNALTGVLAGVASAAFGAMAGAVSAGIGNVLSFFGGIGGRMLGAMGDLGGVLAGAGRAVIDGFLNGITGAFGRVRDTLSNLTSMLPSWKGPPRTDAMILMNAGQLVIGGFIDGLESRYDDVKKSLAGLSMEVGKTTIASPDMSKMDVTSKATMAVNSNLAADQGAASQRTLIYNAAPGSSLSSEESLWAAADRARMVGW